MKGIIIENEYTVDESIQAFLQDNPHIFESIDEQLFCLERKTGDLAQRVLKADAIIVASTWMYKDQLEDYLDAFLDDKFPIKTVFCTNIASTLNDWKTKSSFWNEKELEEKVSKLIKKGWKFYDISQDSFDYVPNTIKGTYWGENRPKFSYSELNIEDGIYYNDYYDLEFQKQWYTNKK